jgi:hypothetical protein
VLGLRNRVKSLEALAAVAAGTTSRRPRRSCDVAEETSMDRVDGVELTSTVDFNLGWLHNLIARTTELDLDERQIKQVARHAERKLVDLFDVGKDSALANGRMRVFLYDLPLTKGLRRAMVDAAPYARGIEADPVFLFLADAGLEGPYDEGIRPELPRLMAALLVLSGNVISILEPNDVPPLERLDLLTRKERDRPTPWEVERAERVLDLTL